MKRLVSLLFLLSVCASADSITFTSGYLVFPTTGYFGTLTNSNGDTADLQSLDSIEFIPIPDDPVVGQTYILNIPFFATLLTANGGHYLSFSGGSCTWSYTPVVPSTGTTVQEPFQCTGQISFLPCIASCDGGPNEWEFDFSNPLLIILNLDGTVTYQFVQHPNGFLIRTDMLAVFTPRDPPSGGGEGGGTITTPEPASLWLLGSGLPLLLRRFRRRSPS
jgi:hypothetical protein